MQAFHNAKGLGILRLLARLEDGIFEALRSPEGQAPPDRPLATIPMGCDLAGIWPRFAHALLADPEHGVLRSVQGRRHARQREAIEQVIALYQTWIATGRKPPAATSAAATVEAYSAASAAQAAAQAAAKAASYVAAVAGAGRRAAGYIAAAAAYEAAEATTSQQQTRQWQAGLLLRLLWEAPIHSSED